jgi:Domain of unknown function (DUF4395)
VGAENKWAVCGRALPEAAPTVLGMSTPVCTRTQIDPRGPRFGATVTSLVLIAAIVLISTPAGVVLVAWQTVVFGLGAFVGLQAQPYGALYRAVLQPRRARPTHLEDAAGPRFAQGVGFVMLALALASVLVGVTVLATILLAFALAAAFLNAAFGFCLGCEIRILGLRVLSR